ncbi:MAG: hypothetical protein ACK5XN_25435 [Bacteroidota bacterium]
MKTQSTLEKVGLQNLQEQLTFAFKKVFIVSEKLDDEIKNFTDWFHKTIENYTSESTIEKYKLKEFKPIMEELYFVWINSPNVDLFHSSETYDNFKLKYNYLIQYQSYERINKNGTYYTVNIDRDDYEGDKVLAIINKYQRRFKKLLRERNINVGEWENLTLQQYLIKEAREVFELTNARQILIVNPSLGRFIKPRHEDIILRHNFPMQKYKMDRTYEQLLNMDLESLKEAFSMKLINELLKEVNPDIDKLLKQIKKYMEVETIDNQTHLIWNFGHKKTINEAPGSYTPKLFDYYQINLSNKEFNYKLKVENHSEETIIASIFIINQRSNTHLIISPEKLLEHSQRIIKRDVKMVNIVNDSILEIHYHGHYSPDSIVFDNYLEAKQYQAMIINRR